MFEFGTWKNSINHVWIYTVDWVGDMVVTQMFPSRVHKPPPSTPRVMWQSWKALEKLKPFHWKKSAICIGCHQAWSSFRPADRDIGSHSVTTQCTQRATIQDAQKRTYRPWVCSSSVCQWGTRRPLLLLYRHCVPFQNPPPPWFPLSPGRMALQQPVGFPHYRNRCFLHLKVSDVAQRPPVLGPFHCSVDCPAASPVQTWETVQCISLCQNFGGFAWVRNWRLDLPTLSQYQMLQMQMLSCGFTHVTQWWVKEEWNCLHCAAAKSSLQESSECFTKTLKGKRKYSELRWAPQSVFYYYFVLYAWEL